MSCWRLAPGLGLGELGALDVEHALELREIAAEGIELRGELRRGGLELANLDVERLELEEVQKLFAQGTTFLLQLLLFRCGPTWV